MYGTDALRWWLTREVPLLGDTEYRHERLVAAYNGDLANGLGNLVNRTLTLVGRHLGGRIDIDDEDQVDGDGWSSRPLDESIAELPGLVDRSLRDADFRQATLAITRTVDVANRFMNASTPWTLAKAPGAGARQQLSRVLSRAVGACRTLAREIAPFTPTSAASLADQLGTGDTVLPGELIFPRIPPVATDG